MADTWTLALFGATGALGQQIRAGLEGEALPITTLLPVAGTRSAGVRIPWAGAEAPVISGAEVDVDRPDITIFACPAEVAREAGERFGRAGALVVDASGGVTSLGDVRLPMLWPGFAVDDLEAHPGGFALPCGPASTLAPIVVALGAAGHHVDEIDVVSLAPALEIGRTGPEALSRQTVSQLSFQTLDRGPFERVMAFNAFGAHGDAQARTGARSQRELAALLGGAAPLTRVSTVRVPVFAGFTGVLTLRLRGPADAPSIATALNASDEITVTPDMPDMRGSADRDAIHVGPPLVDDGTVVRLFVSADPLHRIGQACATLLRRVLDEDLW